MGKDHLKTNEILFSTTFDFFFALLHFNIIYYVELQLTQATHRTNKLLLTTNENKIQIK